MNVKAVVVGAGGISNAWFPVLKDAGVEVAGIVDLDPERAKAQAEKYALPPIIFTNLKKALQKIKPDFVLDLTIPDAHCSVTCTALRAGYPVLGEKPMAPSMAQAHRMVKASEDSGKLYMVSQSRRYVEAHAGLAKFVASGTFGALTSLNCAFYIGAHFGGFRDEMDSPLILDMAIHHFDLARMISRADPVAVYAKEFNPRGSWYKGDVAASCIFEMSDGIIFTYMGSWCASGLSTSWHGDWRIIGEQGTVTYERDQPPVGAIVSEASGFQYPTKPCTIEPVQTAPGMSGSLDEFLKALNGGPTPQGECHDNIKSLAMVFGAIDSSRKGRRVAIQY